MKSIKKTVIVAVLLSALTIGSASALSFAVGVTGDYIGWGIIDSKDYYGGFPTGGGTTVFGEMIFDKFGVGVEAGYEYASTWAPHLLVFNAVDVGAYVYYDFTFAAVPGLAVYPKVGIDVLLNFGSGPFFGLDIQAGAGVEYDFVKLIGFPLFARAEFLFDALLTFPDTFYDGLLVGLGPRIRISAGYKF